MRKEQLLFFNTMMAFKKLNISSMLPEITHGDHVLLYRISCLEDSGQGKVKVSQVVRSMGCPPPAVSRGLRSLDNKGYITRTVDETDRRNTFVALTEEGKEALTEANSIIEEFADAVFSNMGEDNMEKLITQFQRFVDVSREEIEKRKYKK